MLPAPRRSAAGYCGAVACSGQPPAVPLPAAGVPAFVPRAASPPSRHQALPLLLRPVGDCESHRAVPETGQQAEGKGTNLAGLGFSIRFPREGDRPLDTSSLLGHLFPQSHRSPGPAVRLPLLWVPVLFRWSGQGCGAAPSPGPVW